MPAPVRSVGAGLLVVSAAAAGFFGYRLWRAHAPPATLAAVAVADALRPGGAPEPDSVVPDTVPDISLATLDGGQKSLRDYLGQPLIINFWATWCAPCRREIPLLQQLRRQHSHELEVVGIAVDFKSAVAQYLAHTPIAYPLLVGEEQGLAAAERFGMEPVLPFSVFADAQGHIVAVKIGELHREEADFILITMQNLAAASISRAQARQAIAEKLRTLAIERAKTNTGPS